MKFFKRQPRARARVSLILLDWGVRESPHIIHYLRNQTVDSQDFEVIYIEFYNREFDSLRRYEDRVDIWVALEMPRELYYAKHLMYNAGIVLANGNIVVICDVDALVRPTFVERIIRAFEEDENIVLHLDQFRSMRRDFYPFNFPSVDEVIGEGCINNAGGVTTGIHDTRDVIHTRNYGACFCARRADVIVAGGADMHIDYVGHICGPYDLTFRLRNMGRRVVWAEDEFMYHTWHPGTDGIENYLGPHDGRNFSTTSMDFLASGAIAPLSENPAIRRLRASSTNDSSSAIVELIESKYLNHWRADELIARAPVLRLEDYRTPIGVRDGQLLVADHGERRSRAVALGAASSASAGLWLTLLCAVFRLIELCPRLLKAFNLREKSARIPAPNWIRNWILVPLLLLAFPAIVIRGGHIKRRVRIVTGEFRDLSNPLRNLALVLRDLASAGRNDLCVIHDSRVILAALWVFHVLNLIPCYGACLVEDGADLAANIDARRGRVIVIPSSIYVRYHLNVAPVTSLKDVVVV